MINFVKLQVCNDEATSFSCQLVFDRLAQWRGALHKDRVQIRLEQVSNKSKLLTQMTALI